MSDFNYTIEDVVKILELILRQNGPQLIAVLGQYLQQKTDPSISKYVKTKFGGLKSVLLARSDLFRMEGVPPAIVVGLVNQQQMARRPQSASMSGYLSSVIAAINRGDFRAISRALQLFGGVQTAELTEELLQYPSFDAVAQKIPGKLWPKLFVSHFQTFCNWRRREYEDAYNSQQDMLLAIRSHFESGISDVSGVDSAFPLPVFNVILVDLRLIAKWADKGISKHKGSTHQLLTSDKMRTATNQMQGLGMFCIGRSGSDRSPRRFGVLTLVNQIFKISFYLNTINLCKPVLAMLDTRVKGDELPDFPVGQYVTHCFYKGRLDTFENNFVDAERHLRIAFTRCNKNKFKNKRLSLLYLAPISMLFGKYPNQKLLEKYRLTPFITLARAVRQGNVALYNQNLQENERFYRQRHIWLIVLRLKTVLYRNFIRRFVYVSGSEKLDLRRVWAVLKGVGDDIDFDELECILAGLISAGYIKGYIRHKPPAMVLASTGAFPKKLR